jgi:hypothetical protein
VWPGKGGSGATSIVYRSNILGFIVSSPSSFCPPILAFSAEVGPRHCPQTCCGNRPLAGGADPIPALSHPNERLLDSSKKAPIGLMQANLKLRFGIGVGLVHKVPFEISSRWHEAVNIGMRGRQLRLPCE